METGAHSARSDSAEAPGGGLAPMQGERGCRGGRALPWAVSKEREPPPGSRWARRQWERPSQGSCWEVGSPDISTRQGPTVARCQPVLLGLGGDTP